MPVAHIVDCTIKALYNPINCPVVVHTDYWRNRVLTLLLKQVVIKTGDCQATHWQKERSARQDWALLHPDEAHPPDDLEVGEAAAASSDPSSEDSTCARKRFRIQEQSTLIARLPQVPPPRGHERDFGM